MTAGWITEDHHIFWDMSAPSGADGEDWEMVLRIEILTPAQNIYEDV